MLTARMVAGSAEAKAETPAESSPCSPLYFQVPGAPSDPHFQTTECIKCSLCGCCMQYECFMNPE